MDVGWKEGRLEMFQPSGKREKYCKMSLTVKEESLHAAIVRAINKFNSQDHAAYLALMKATIGEALGIQAETAEIDELKRRIDALNQKMVSIIQKAARDGEDIEEHESEFKEMAESIALFKQRISVLEQAKVPTQRCRSVWPRSKKLSMSGKHIRMSTMTASSAR